MLIFDNLQSSATFSVVLRDKSVQESDTLILVLTKLDTLTEQSFSLTNSSTSADYYTFTINPSQLEQGDYVAEIQIPLPQGDCEVSSQEIVQTPTVFDCDPLNILSEFVVSSEALIGDGFENEVVWITKCRVEGVSYNQIYRNDSAPQYYVYNE